MLLKIVGAIFIIFSTSAAGWYFSMRDKYRIEDLREMRRALTILKGEMTYSTIPIGESFLEIAKRISGSVSELMEEMGAAFSKKEGCRAEEIWNQVLQNFYGKTYFDKEDIEMLVSFGKILSYPDGEQQKNHIDLTINYLNNMEGTLEARHQKNAKVYRSMGALFGALLAVIMM